MNREVICFDASRSREGAWIEIPTRTLSVVPLLVAPARERGLKFKSSFSIGSSPLVAPARERGLKSVGTRYTHRQYASRSREGAWIEIK